MEKTFNSTVKNFPPKSEVLSSLDRMNYELIIYFFTKKHRIFDFRPFLKLFQFFFSKIAFWSFGFNQKNILWKTALNKRLYPVFSTLRCSRIIQIPRFLHPKWFSDKSNIWVFERILKLFGFSRKVPSQIADFGFFQKKIDKKYPL